MMTDAHDPSFTDAELLAAYAAGNSDAARKLAARVLPGVLGQATRLDVAQEAMMRLWKIAPDWREGEAQISTWLYRVVANLCTDRLRKRTRAGAVGIDQVAEPADPVPDVAARG